MQAESIEPADFTFQLSDINLDKFSQNLQVMQMKLWLHLLDYFRATKVLNHSGMRKDDFGDEIIEQELEILDLNINTKHSSSLDSLLTDIEAIQHAKSQIAVQIQRKSTTMAQYDSLIRSHDELQMELKEKKQRYKEAVRAKYINSDGDEMPQRAESFKEVRSCDQAFVTLTHRHFARKIFK